MTPRQRFYLRFLIVALPVLGVLLWAWFHPRPPAPALQSVAFIPLEDEIPSTKKENRPEQEPAAQDPFWNGIAMAAGDSIAESLGPGLSEEQIEFERLPGSMLFPHTPMKMEAAIWRAYQMIATNPAADAAELGLKMLSSSNAWVRTTGAIWMLEKNQRLAPEILDQLMADEEAFVPLTVLGWMLDAGIETEAQQFESRWKTAPQEAWQAAIYALMDEPLNGMAGRASLWMAARSDWPITEQRELMTDVTRNTNVSYDVRWKAAMLLQPRMEVADYRRRMLEMLDMGSLSVPYLPENPAPISAEERENDSLEIDDLFPVAMQMLNVRVAVPEAIALHPVLEPEDADLFFAQESSLMLENVALWVEAAIDQQEIEVRPGFTAALARQLENLPVEELPANQRITLRRIQSRMERLAQLE